MKAKIIVAKSLAENPKQIRKGITVADYFFNIEKKLIRMKNEKMLLFKTPTNIIMKYPISDFTRTGLQRYTMEMMGWGL